MVRKWSPNGVDSESPTDLTFVTRSAGGVKLIAGNNRITMDNTLDERLKLLEDRVSNASIITSI